MKTIQLLVEREMMDTGREMQKEEGKILDDVKTLATMETVTRKQTNQSLKHTGRTGKTTWKKGEQSERKESMLQNKHTHCVSGFVAASAFRPTGKHCDFISGHQKRLIICTSQTPKRQSCFQQQRRSLRCQKNGWVNCCAASRAGALS